MHAMLSVMTILTCDSVCRVRHDATYCAAQRLRDLHANAIMLEISGIQSVHAMLSVMTLHAYDSVSSVGRILVACAA